MKISICIPVYNFDVRNLVFDLKKEIAEKRLNAEIILIDDASEKSFVEINKPLQNEVSQFIFLNQNIGRSAIRNLFLKYANGDYFLFLDCDCAIINDDFLEKYFDFLNENPEAKVIYGGFEENTNVRNLRSLYSRKREIQDVGFRRLNPYSTFKGINFLIKKTILTQVLFDEEIKSYGYEDWLYAYKLSEQNYEINHTHNPVLHLDNSSSIEFLTKTKESVKTLSLLLSDSTKCEYVANMKIVRAYNLLHKRGLNNAASKIFEISNNLIMKVLIARPSITLLDFYKLGLLCTLMKKR